LWTYGRTDVPTDAHFRPPVMLLGRLGGVDLTKCNHNTMPNPNPDLSNHNPKNGNSAIRK